MTSLSQTTESNDPRRMTREERARRCGVDCPDAIVWRHWGVGGEYLRKLVLKNTHDKLQVLQYKLPRQKATFFVDFPEPVTLSSGMAYELVVRFRPTAMVPHQDSIEIEVKGRGSFLVDLVALTPYARLDAPEKHDFGLCPVDALSKTTLPITNSGTVPLSFVWEAPAPFKVEPAAASLTEGEAMNIQVSFVPTDASAMVAQAVCKTTAGEMLSVLKLSGIGKYAFVKPTTDPHVDFGAVLTSTSVQKVVVVENKSCVDAAFELTRVDRDIVNPFHIAPMRGVIPRDGQQKFTIKYSPESTSAHYTNDFRMTVVGGNEVAFRLTGTAIGPQVTLSVRTLDFGDVDLDKEASDGHEKIIVLKNKAETPVHYQFVGVDPGSAFVITPFTGTLGGRKLQNIRVKFAPGAAINYLRRVHVLVNHSDQALFIDLLGTAYNSKSRPAPFNHKHVRYYMARVAGGLARTTPDDIEKLMSGIRDNVEPADEDEAAAREALTTALASAEAALTSKTEPLDTVLPAEERLQLPFSLEESRVLFRAGVDAQSVTVRNHTSAKATAVWAVPEGCPWVVQPATADIPAFSTVAFKVKLSPGAPTTCFGHYVECYCFYKSMRSFRLVSEETFTPSQCLQLLCQRITTLNETSATPQITLPDHVAFPSCHQQDCVYQVLPLKNEGDTVAAFDIAIEAQVWKQKATKMSPIFEATPQEDEEDSALQEATLRSVFTCFPTSGVIQPNATALVLFKFAPPKTQRYRGVAQVSFNESTIGGRQILLRGEGFVPQLRLSNNSMLTFRPTSVGGEMTRAYDIENPSRIPVTFEVQVPAALRSIVTMQPESGTLVGCEKATLQATFAPKAAKTYEMKIPVVVRALKPPAGITPTVSRQVCHAIGDGVIGVLAIEPLEVHFGTALVGADAQRTITIYNSSLCDVQYRLDYLVRGPNSDAPPLSFTPQASGLLRARSHVNAEVLVKLPYRGTFSYTVYVVSGGSDAIVDATKPTADDVERLPHCNVTVTGEHPTLEITDVRSVYQRKSHLWRQLSVTRINDMLKAPVLTHDIETRSFTFEGATQGIEPIMCDLGVDVFRTAPIRVLLRLDNVSHCPVNFHFWFPHESEVPKEPWHQEEQHDDAQVAEIIDRRLFDVSPREATIPAGGHQVVLFTYQHTKIGQHTLPVLLRLDKGKRLLLHLTARTLHESTKFLAFHHTLTHELLPVAIGDLEPPLQYSELQNLSHQPATYTVEQDALQQLRERNYDFPIFQCLNPGGTIPPMSTLLLSWYFRPLEAKRYQVNVRIRVEGGETYVLSLGGTGYHPKKVTKEQIIAMHERDVFPLPKYPTLKHPLLPLRLSMDVLRFNTVPFHSLHRQVISLQNCHATDTFLFEWHCVLQFGDQMLDVDPPRGRIAPGETRQFRVTMYSGSTSHIIDNPIHCHVLNEDLRMRRLARRAARESEAAMQLDQPAENNDATSASGGSLTQAANAARLQQRGPRTRQPVTTIPAKYQSTGRLRQAIQQLTEAAVAEELDDDDDELTYVDVLPTVLEVLVQARIMPIDAYAEIYGEARAQAHFYPTLRVYSSDAPVAPVSDASDREQAIVFEVLDELLRQVVQSKGVREAYTDVSEDPVPYFCEMLSEDTASSALLPSAANATSPSSVDDAQPAGTGAGAALPGTLQCLIEEVLEGALYAIAAEAQGADGVMTRVVDQLATAAKLSRHVGGGTAAANGLQPGTATARSVNFNETATRRSTIGASQRPSVTAAIDKQQPKKPAASLKQTPAATAATAVAKPAATTRASAAAATSTAAAARR